MSRELIDRVLAIRPERSGDGRYSHNLHRWLLWSAKRYQKVESQWWGVYSKQAPLDASTLYIGSADSAGYLFGSRLSEIITEGRGAGRWAVPSICSTATNVTDEFWESYLQIGKCTFDRDHFLYGDKGRYATAKEIRSCQWCGCRVNVEHDIHFMNLSVVRNPLISC